MRRAGSFVLLLALVVWFAAGCASTGGPGAADAPSPRVAPVLDLAAPGLEESALLLLLVDRQLYEPFSIGRVLASNRPGLRRTLGFTLGRVPDVRSTTALEELLIDADPEVRLAAAFAAGRIGGPEAATLLEGLLVDEADRVAAWACHGLARGGTPLDRVVARLAPLTPAARQARLLPDLHRFAAARGGAVYQALAVEGLTASDPWLRRRALLALVVAARPAQRPVFRRLLGDADAGLRALAARGLAAVGVDEDLEPLRAASADEALEVAVEAIEAAAAIVRAGRAAPPAAWRETLLERLTDPRPGVRATALTAASAWLLDEALEAALGEAFEGGVPAERARALLALAAARAPAAGAVAVRAADDAEPRVRAAAARAAATLEARALLDRLGSDPAPVVRAAAFRAAAGAAAWPAHSLYTRFLADPAPSVRVAVLERLSRQPIVVFESVLEAFARDERAEPELALAGVAALQARAMATPTERGAIVAALEGLAEVGTHPVRIRAAEAVVALGRDRPSIGPATVTRAPGDYRSVAARTRRTRWATLATARGAATLRFDCPDAALSCLAFLQLAEQGFFDRSAVYRVDPGVRLEAGDPDGDGHGGPGFTLRDEPAPRRLDAGAVGLVWPAPHAAGARFFVQLGDGYELEGEVTLLGVVESGLDVLAGLLEGDRIVSLREIAPPAERPARSPSLVNSRAPDG